MNILSVPVRYPDDLQNILRDFNIKEIKRIYDSSKEVILWMKKKLQKLQELY